MQLRLPQCWQAMTVFVFLAALVLLQSSQSGQSKSEKSWDTLPVPGAWEEVSKGKYKNYDGLAWYRCLVKIPKTWQGDDLSLTVQSIDNCFEVFVNGHRVGSSGKFPPNYQNGLSNRPVSYSVPADKINAGAANLIAFRIYDDDGRGGFKGAPPILANETLAIPLKGNWQFRTGDNIKWTNPNSIKNDNIPTFFRYDEISTVRAKFFKKETAKGGLSPEEAMRKFQIADDLEIKQVLTEPIVRQPVSLNFDERGRMWVVQYLQYPNPAGLKLLSRDNYWRNVYDKVPPAPPHHFRGKDKITIHEDTDGDGIYDRHKTFVDGLNIVTAVTKGRGGVWVLNPPYLLFYPDKNNDDIPDGDPVVHLSGFGLEDTHSVVNSLCWGPDGWLYAAQGSTVSAQVRVSGKEKDPPQHSIGQLIWRYHPETKRYEIFAEGGGNAFGVEIDRKGRVYSGHNGGNTRGFHYVQGGYYQKGFSKHGPISNPYSYGYFPAIKHPQVPRFTHTFTIYDGKHLPSFYQGKLLGISPMLNYVVCSDISSDGSSFQTKDLNFPVRTNDTWFRPVDIKHGPDGAIYIADWYDGQVNHYRNHEGQMDARNGRIYRLARKGAGAHPLPDLSKKSSKELALLLNDENRWVRRTALRLLGDRKDRESIPFLRNTCLESSGQLALENLWALHLSGGFDEAFAMKSLEHSDPHVRLWTVRLLGDRGKIDKLLSQKIERMAQTEKNIEVRSQMACSARRFPAEIGLPILAQLMTHGEDVNDIHMPLLLWWGLEQHCSNDPSAVLKLFHSDSLWDEQIVREHLLQRLMRRFADPGTNKDLLICARLLEMAPSQDHAKKLLEGFEQAYAGRSLANIPKELALAMSKRGGGSLSLQLRLGDAKAVQNALKLCANQQTDAHRRVELIEILGEIKAKEAWPTFLDLLRQSKSNEVRRASALALLGFSSAKIPNTLIELHDQFPDMVRSAAQTVLLSRENWTLQWLNAIDNNRINKKLIDASVVRRMTVHANEEIRQLISKNWGDVQGATTEAMQREIESLAKVIQKSAGSPYEGKKLFQSNCAKCHTLFRRGGNIGPDLTAYDRRDLPNMLLHIVNPSAEIREGFENYLVVTNDGRVLNGFLVGQDRNGIVLRNAEGQDVKLVRDAIEEMRVLQQSIMPEGLLRSLSEQQVRDLFAYLRSSQPLNN